MQCMRGPRGRAPVQKIYCYIAIINSMMIVKCQELCIYSYIAIGAGSIYTAYPCMHVNIL